MSMEIKTFTFNHFGENTYLVVNNEKKICTVIDPGCFFDKEKEELKNYINSNGYTLDKIVFTHCHLDHAFGAKYLYDEFPIIEIAGHKDEMFFIEDAINQSFRFGIKMDQPPSITNFIDNGDKILLAGVEFDCIHVPGHSAGSICYYHKESKSLIVGDVLFSGSIGRSDLPFGDGALLVNGIKTKLLTLPDDVVVYSGHGPTTTIGTEKFSNPFLV